MTMYVEGKMGKQGRATKERNSSLISDMFGQTIPCLTIPTTRNAATTDLKLENGVILTSANWLAASAAHDGLVNL